MLRSLHSLTSLNFSSAARYISVKIAPESAAGVGQGRAATCRRGSAAAGFSLSQLLHSNVIYCSQCGSTLHELFSPLHSHPVYLELISQMAQNTTFFISDITTLSPCRCFFLLINRWYSTFSCPWNINSSSCCDFNIYISHFPHPNSYLNPVVLRVESWMWNGVELLPQSLLMEWEKLWGSGNFFLASE